MYPYEQGLTNGKWLIGFDRKKHLVQRTTSDGKWVTTKKGLDSFRYNKDTYQVLFPVRPAHPPKMSKKVDKEMLWKVDKVDPKFDYALGHDDDRPWTVGAIKGPAPGSRMSLLATDKEKEDHVRAAGGKWLKQRQTIEAVDLTTRVKGKWKVVSHDSPKKWVHDPTRPIRVNRTRENVNDRRSAATDDILERPLRHYIAIPSDCYRPWDLHPQATMRTSASS